MKCAGGCGKEGKYVMRKKGVKYVVCGSVECSSKISGIPIRKSSFRKGTNEDEFKKSLWKEANQSMRKIKTMQRRWKQENK